MATVELRFAALPAHVRTARLIAGVLARRAGVHEAVIDEIKLAVGEACARAVAVHQRHCPQEPVLLRAIDGVEDSAGLPAFVLEVQDRGPAGEGVPRDARGAVPVAFTLLDVEQVSDPDGGEAGLPAGMELALIEGLVDDLQVLHADTGEGTLVRMTWPLFLAELGAG